MSHPLGRAASFGVPSAVGTIVLAAIVLGAIAGWFARDLSGAGPAPAVPEPGRNECACGEVRSCAFGPGIVGRQACRTGPLMVNGWSRCEPVDGSPARPGECVVPCRMVGP